SRTDLVDRLIERRLATARDVDVRALCREPLRGRETDSAVCARDDCDLVVQLTHNSLSVLMMGLNWSHACLISSINLLVSTQKNESTRNNRDDESVHMWLGGGSVRTGRKVEAVGSVSPHAQHAPLW